MKRVTEEVLNDHQPAKKVKVDLDHTTHDHDASVNGWSKVEKKKKKKENKATTAKQNVSRSGQFLGFITQFVACRSCLLVLCPKPSSWRTWLL
jgi:ribosomal protein S14